MVVPLCLGSALVPLNGYDFLFTKLNSLNAGLEFEFYDEIYAGRTYVVSVKITDVYEKTGRSGPLGVFVREMLIRDDTGRLIVLMRERRMVRSPEKKI
jgi:N-terminal half of MaoC dehydratase